MYTAEYGYKKVTVGGALVAGALVLLVGCGLNSKPAIEADQPALLLDKSQDDHYVAGSGYDHWETDFHFILKQCGREDEDIADDEGCVTVDVPVNAPTYGKYAPGVSITFDNELHGDLVTG